MGRNHFSKAGGPYFINDGFSKHVDHSHSDEPGHTHKETKQDSTVFGMLAMGFLIMMVCISIALMATL